ncbi:hypothetical protein ACFVU2_19105 [Leifsonia sp. NPDC058194]|uniref:hypothetical protein n=1 Tax=Leifsonia sp. NPDC058194 TaxID=3346374 RepID=UPI0036DCC043
MSQIQKLSPKSTRQLARDLNEPTITRAWVDNGFDHNVVMFTTWDHEHGFYNRRTGQRGEPLPGGGGWHLPSCYDDRGQLLLDCDPFEDDGRWPVQGYDR